MTSKLIKPQTSIVPPLVTPLKDINTLDVDGLERSLNNNERN